MYFITIHGNSSSALSCYFYTPHTSLKYTPTHAKYWWWFWHYKEIFCHYSLKDKKKNIIILHMHMSEKAALIGTREHRRGSVPCSRPHWHCSGGELIQSEGTSSHSVHSCPSRAWTTNPSSSQNRTQWTEPLLPQIVFMSLCTYKQINWTVCSFHLHVRSPPTCTDSFCASAFVIL